jgi:hypothetical protein
MKAEDFPTFVDRLEAMAERFGRRGDLADDSLKSYFLTLRPYPIAAIERACEQLLRDGNRRTVFPAPAEIERVCRRYTDPESLTAEDPLSGPQLVPANDLEDAIVTMLRMFNHYVTESLLREYLEVVSDVPPVYVYRACKDWIKYPLENRAARAHELRLKAMAVRDEATRATTPPVPEPPPETLSRSRRDALFAELLREQPDNQFLQEYVRERAATLGDAQDPVAEVDALTAQLTRPRRRGGERPRAPDP